MNCYQLEYLNSFSIFFLSGFGTWIDLLFYILVNYVLALFSASMFWFSYRKIEFIYDNDFDDILCCDLDFTINQRDLLQGYYVKGWLILNVLTDKRGNRIGKLL